MLKYLKIANNAQDTSLILILSDSEDEVNTHQINENIQNLKKTTRKNSRTYLIYYIKIIKITLASLLKEIIT